MTKALVARLARQPMLAALTAIEASPLAGRIGDEAVIESDEETGAFSSNR